MITAAEVRRWIADLEKKPRRRRRDIARVIGDVARPSEPVQGGVSALTLRSQNAMGDKV
jgi:hypothetical protein